MDNISQFALYEQIHEDLQFTEIRDKFDARNLMEINCLRRENEEMRKLIAHFKAWPLPVPASPDHESREEYPIDFRIEIARKHIAGGVSYADLSEQYGVKRPTLADWVSTYKTHGESGFKTKAKRAAHA